MLLNAAIIAVGLVPAIIANVLSTIAISRSRRRMVETMGRAR